jgi:hypothetical protein
MGTARAQANDPFLTAKNTKTAKKLTPLFLGWLEVEFDVPSSLNLSVFIRVIRRQGSDGKFDQARRDAVLHLLKPARRCVFIDPNFASQLSTMGSQLLMTVIQPPRVAGRVRHESLAPAVHTVDRTTPG